MCKTNLLKMDSTFAVWYVCGLKAFHFWQFIINSTNMPKSIFYEFSTFALLFLA